MTGGSAIVRPWLKAGLSALLLESEERVLQLRAQDGPQEAAPQIQVQAPRPAPSFPQRQAPAAPVPSKPASPAARPPAPAQAQDRAFPPAAGTRQPAAPAAMPQSRPVPERRPEPAPRPRAAASAGDMFLTPGAVPVEQWPAGWLALKDRRPLPPRPLVLWSYAGLGDDLTGTPDQARRQVIVRMLTELRHPGGTHVFWPFDMSGTPALPKAADGEEASLFWSGVRLLDPRVLLLFGSDTRDALMMPRTLRPFCQERVYGRLVIQLPRPQALAEDEASFRRAQAFLARLLSFCARR